MNCLKFFIFLFVLAAVPGWAADLGRFNGVYEFVRLETPDGPSASQKGMLILQDGYLCHVRTRKDREKIPDQPKEEMMKKSAEAFAASNATCGTFTMEGDKVTATWHTNVDPNDEANASSFIFTKQEDLLFISPGGDTRFKLVYRKVK